MRVKKYMWLFCIGQYIYRGWCVSSRRLGCIKPPIYTDERGLASPPIKAGSSSRSALTSRCTLPAFSLDFQHQSRTWSDPSRGSVNCSMRWWGCGSRGRAKRWTNPEGSSAADGHRSPRATGGEGHLSGGDIHFQHRPAESPRTRTVTRTLSQRVESSPAVELGSGRDCNALREGIRKPDDCPAFVGPSTDSGGHFRLDIHRAFPPSWRRPAG